MDVLTQSNDVVICKHRLHYQGCRVCQMTTFLFCREQIQPFLVRDVCTLIFSHLPRCIVVPPPPRGTCYELEHCYQARVPINQDNKNAVCGVAFRRNECPYLLYCLSPATKQGVSGLWSCGAHCKRPNPDPTGRSGKMVCKEARLSGFGINYTYPGELPPIQVPMVEAARIPPVSLLNDPATAAAFKEDFAEPESKTTKNSRCSVQILNGKDYVTVTMSRPEMADLNLPGREIFGPLTQAERSIFIELLRKSKSLSDRMLGLFRNPAMIKLNEEISGYLNNLEADKLFYGPIPLKSLIDGFNSELEKILSQTKPD